MAPGNLLDLAGDLDHEATRLHDARTGNVDGPHAAADADVRSEIEGLNRHRGIV